MQSPLLRRTHLAHRAVGALDLAGQIELGEDRLQRDAGLEQHHGRVAPDLLEGRRDALLDEQIDRRLLRAGHLDAAAARRAERAGEPEHERPRVARCVALDAGERDEARPVDVGVADADADHPRRDEHDVHVVGKADLAVGDRVAAGEADGRTGPQRVFDVRGDGLAHHLVGDQKADDVGVAHGFGDVVRFEAVGCCRFA